MKQRVGLVGFGNMGGRMARRLVDGKSKDRSKA